MIGRTIVFSPEARADLLELYDWVANAASPDTAMAYVKRIEQFISGLELGPERGTTYAQGSGPLDLNGA